MNSGSTVVASDEFVASSHVRRESSLSSAHFPSAAALLSLLQIAGFKSPDRCGWPKIITSSSVLDSQILTTIGPSPLPSPFMQRQGADGASHGRHGWTGPFHEEIPFHGHVVIRRQSRSFHPSNFVRIPFPVPSLCICASARKEEFDAVSLDEMLTGSHWRADEATAKRAFPAAFSSDSGVPILRYRRRVGVSGSPAVAFTGGRVLVELCRAR